jgi:hypothetical protein
VESHIINKVTIKELRRVAANKLNKQSRTADRGVVLQLGGKVGGLRTPRHKTSNLLQIVIEILGQGRIPWQEPDTEKWI